MSLSRPSEAAGEAGSASLEFLLVGVLLLVPLVYLVITLAQVQQQTLGVESAARNVARVIAGGAADGSAEAIVAGAVEEYGMDRDALEVSVTCAPAGACPRAGAIVTVRITTIVPIPLLPNLGSGITVGAVGTERVSSWLGQG
ncbi:TadE/TadG family type IV pilus assembly protein [Microbacterium gorillae]|uniref:TadE/TadG family type IV pilus assembly protein n=1 Tax=Microbacterium gorillae TaxID=1231063 RepID=UPI000590CB84|nr:TadE/TadG family type IV pilus assembly protein [Microbacterium gorillae]